MSTKNKSVASQAILEMRAIKAAMQNESKDTIKTLLADAVKDTLRESIADDDCIIIEGKKASKKKTQDIDEDDTEMQGQEETPEAGTEEMPDETGVDGGADAQGDVPAEGEEGDVDMSQYQVDGDPNTLDLTGEQDPEKVIKVYKLLKQDDQVVITKDSDGKINLKDEQTGAEYVIDVDGDENVDGEEPVETAEEPQGGEDIEPLEESFEFEFDDIDENEPMGDDAELQSSYEELEECGDLYEGFEDDSEGDDFSFDDEDNDFSFDDEDEDGESFEGECEPMLKPEGEDDFNDDDVEYEDDFDDFINDGEFETEEGTGYQEIKENKKTKKCMKEKVYEIDLGYTDSYQKEDPIDGLTVSGETSFDAGVKERGTKKPWSSLKAKQEPYVNEDDENADDVEVVDEAATSKSKRDRRHMTKTRSTGSGEQNPEVTKVHTNESLEKIKKENKALKEAIGELKTNLKEAYVTNVNLGKITRLFLENTTSQKEKIEIVNRFVNEAKTVKQSNRLYESISKELKKAPAKTPVTENTIAAKPAVTETKIYESRDLVETRDFMKRMLSC